MSSLSSEEINHLAQLTRISLSDEESKRFEVEMPKIIAFVEELSAADTSEIVEQTAAAIDSLRPDQVAQTGLTLEDLRKLAPGWSSNQVEVPGVFENNDG